MSIVHSVGDFAVEQLPIEQIEPGDTIIANTDDGTPYVYQVHVKRIEIDKTAGTSMVMLQGEPRPGVELVPQSGAPIGTLAHRIIPRPNQPEEQPTRVTAADDADYRHPKCYANTRGGCSTKISGEHFISHSLIKLYSFDDPDLTIKHDSGYGIREFVKPGKFVAPRVRRSAVFVQVRRLPDLRALSPLEAES